MGGHPDCSGGPGRSQGHPPWLLSLSILGLPGPDDLPNSVPHRTGHRTGRPTPDLTLGFPRGAAAAQRHSDPRNALCSAPLGPQKCPCGDRLCPASPGLGAGSCPGPPGDPGMGRREAADPTWPLGAHLKQRSACSGPGHPETVRVRPAAMGRSPGSRRPGLGGGWPAAGGAGASGARLPC